MKSIDALEEIYLGVSANKVRSGLTVLGIVIGIASVIAMISIGQGAQGAIQSSIEGLGSNLLTIMPGVIQPGRGIVSSGRGSAQTLKEEDAAVVAGVAHVEHVSPEVNRRFQVVAPSGNNTNATVYGVAPDYLIVRNVTVASGEFVNDAHLRNFGRVAVLGPTTANDLFGASDPVGQTIRVSGANLRVIGVLQAKGSAGFFSPDEAVFVPLTTMQKILTGSDSLSLIAASVTSKEYMDQAKTDVTYALATKHKVDLATPDFSIVSQADILGTLNQVTGTFTIFLASIAGISLLVGGIGIMNMMLTTVTERTREIGLRQAIGARKADIISQFLGEAVLLTLIGGGVGVAIGYGVSKLVSSFANMPTLVSWPAIGLAFGVSAAIGLIFGFYPARRAARLHPIQALRYE